MLGIQLSPGVNPARHVCALVVYSLLLGAAGCGGPTPIAPPDWDPEAMADSAIKLYDQDGNAVLDAKELAAAPGLQAAVAKEENESPDIDRDGKLSREEIRDHIGLFEKSGLGIQRIAVTVLMDRQPLAGAEVTLVPEPFLEGVLDPARDTTRQDGTARPAIEIEDMQGVRPGIYRVKITHPDRKIPAKYNDSTTLGLDLAPARSGYNTQMPVFRLESQ